MEEESFNEKANQQAEVLPAGIPDPNEWKLLKEFENRYRVEELSKDEVKKIIEDQNFKHPFKRTMVRVDSVAFRWACQMVTGKILKAKHKKMGVIHFECCNIIWIGSKPRQCTHLVNEKLRSQFDTRALIEKRYNPTYIPINVIQYMRAGGCPIKLDQRVADHVLEQKEMMSTASTYAESDDESEEDPQDGVFLG